MSVPPVQVVERDWEVRRVVWVVVEAGGAAAAMGIASGVAGVGSGGRVGAVGIGWSRWRSCAARPWMRSTAD